MTEKERYTLHQNGNYHTVIDEKKNVTLIISSYACFHKIIDLLNEQEETINILKASNMEYEDALGRLEEQTIELENELATYKRKFLDCVDRKMGGTK